MMMVAFSVRKKQMFYCLLAHIHRCENEVNGLSIDEQCLHSRISAATKISLAHTDVMLKITHPYGRFQKSFIPG